MNAFCPQVLLGLNTFDYKRFQEPQCRTSRCTTDNLSSLSRSSILNTLFSYTFDLRFPLGMTHLVTQPVKLHPSSATGTRVRHRNLITWAIMSQLESY